MGLSREVTCGACSAAIPRDARFCPFCGGSTAGTGPISMAIPSLAKPEPKAQKPARKKQVTGRALELDLPTHCVDCGARLGGRDDAIAARCNACRKKRDAPGRPLAVATSAPKKWRSPLFAKNTFVLFGSALMMLGSIAVVVLLVRYRPDRAAQRTDAGARVPWAHPSASAMAPAEAARAMQDVLAKLPPPGTVDERALEAYQTKGPGPSLEELETLENQSKGEPFRLDSLEHPDEPTVREATAAAQYIEQVGRRSGPDMTQDPREVAPTLQALAKVAPEAAAQAEAALLPRVDDAQSLERELAASASSSPSLSVKLAHAEASIEKAPGQALATAERALGASSTPRAAAAIGDGASKGAVVAQAARVRGLALFALGELAQAEATLRSRTPDDATANFAYVELLSRAGRCSEAGPVVRAIAERGAVPGVVFLMRHTVLCQGAIGYAALLAEQVVDRPRVSSADRAAVVATLALLHLWSDRPGEALLGCEALEAAAPGELDSVRQAYARCALARGHVDQAVARLGPSRKGPAALIAALPALTAATASNAALTRDQRTSLGNPPPWDAAAAMLRAMGVLRVKGRIDDAVDAARCALVAPRWDGSPVVPWSRLELLAIAELGPEKHRATLRALARTLSQKDDELRQSLLGQEKLPVPQALLTLRELRAGELTAAAARLHDDGGGDAAPRVLRSYLRARAEGSKGALLRLVDDPELGATAFRFAGGARAVSTATSETLRKRWLRHPDYAAAMIGAVPAK